MSAAGHPPEGGGEQADNWPSTVKLYTVPLAYPDLVVKGARLKVQGLAINQDGKFHYVLPGGSVSGKHDIVVDSEAVVTQTLATEELLACLIQPDAMQSLLESGGFSEAAQNELKATVKGSNVFAVHRANQPDGTPIWHFCCVMFDPSSKRFILGQWFNADPVMQDNMVVTCEVTEDGERFQMRLTAALRRLGRVMSRNYKFTTRRTLQLTSNQQPQAQTKHMVITLTAKPNVRPWLVYIHRESDTWQLLTTSSEYDPETMSCAFAGEIEGREVMRLNTVTHDRSFTWVNFPPLTNNDVTTEAENINTRLRDGCSVIVIGEWFSDQLANEIKFHKFMRNAKTHVQDQCWVLLWIRNPETNRLNFVLVQGPEPKNRTYQCIAVTNELMNLLLESWSKNKAWQNFGLVWKDQDVKEILTTLEMNTPMHCKTVYFTQMHVALPHLVQLNEALATQNIADLTYGSCVSLKAKTNPLVPATQLPEKVIVSERLSTCDQRPFTVMELGKHLVQESAQGLFRTILYHQRLQGNRTIVEKHEDEGVQAGSAELGRAVDPAPVLGALVEEPEFAPKPELYHPEVDRVTFCAILAVADSMIPHVHVSKKDGQYRISCRNPVTQAELPVDNLFIARDKSDQGGLLRPKPSQPGDFTVLSTINQVFEHFGVPEENKRQQYGIHVTQHYDNAKSIADNQNELDRERERERESFRG